MMSAALAPGTVPEPHAPTETEREKAAGIIQKNYRGHRTRNALKGFGLDPQTRWFEAIRDAQYQALTTPMAPRKIHTGGGEVERVQSPGRTKWARATKIAAHAGRDDESAEEDGVSESPSETEAAKARMTPEQRREYKDKRDKAREARKKNAKMMDLQYFLEMVDLKHRYGSNLRKYHAYWKTLDTDDSFFYWLDQGGGKTLDMPECTRIRLDKEQVRYLSREERMHYLVKIDDHGLLRWTKNDELVWTKDELYKDSMKGIVPIDDKTPKYKHNVAPEGVKDKSSSSEDEEAEQEDQGIGGDAAERYVNEDFHRAKGPAKIKHVSAGVLFNHMIRNSMKRGHKWIFLADTSFRMYIGYKQPGAFQHSSFLRGSRITAAGQIKVKHGQLRSLEPLSGHYRPPADNFKAFVQSLRDEGVDMSRVSISKSYAVLIGMEQYTRTKKKFEKTSTGLSHHKNKLLHPEKVKEEEEARKDKSESAERERQYLERLRLEETKDDKPSFGARFSKTISNWKSHKVSSAESDQREMDGRGIRGTGPEDGIPPPEGTR